MIFLKNSYNLILRKLKIAKKINEIINDKKSLSLTKLLKTLKKY